MSEFHRLRLTRFDFDAADFLESEDVAAMTAAEVGQLMLLFSHAWLSGKDATLPKDPKILAKLARSPRGVSPKVLRKFQPTRDDRLHNPRLTSEWEAACLRAGRRHEKAQRAAEERWKKHAPSNSQAFSGHESSMTGAMHGRFSAVPPSPAPSPNPTPNEAAHVDQAKTQGARPSAVEKAVRLSLFNRERWGEKTAPAWCNSPLLGELYAGIYRKDIEERFFDCRNMGFEKQVAECVQAAVTALATNRVRRFAETRLDAREVEIAAIERLQGPKEVLAQIQNYETRRAQTMAAVCRVVTEAAAELIVAHGGAGKE
jgi:uncharacterized protein YdaU (DUF1376 family)